ncbi:MAG TPA: hypothetical protein VHE61_02800 [Opitutaceae bacterium]|nr:hypothetical protein [Opitutaceae bacterium]
MPFTSPVLRRALLVAAVISAALVWALALANCWLALQAPFELEVREGTVWLYVLAQDAGVSLYDHAQVAFLNMNHGPLNPIFAWWVHRLMPFLPAPIVTRAFVALLPVGLVGLFLTVVRQPVVALLWAGGMYLFLLGLGPVEFLIGRSDPAALFFLAVLLSIAVAMGRSVGMTPTRTGILAAALGAIGAVIMLLNWRYAPPVGAVWLVAGAEHGLDAALGTRTRRAACYAMLVVLGAAAVFGLVIATEFHGNLRLYYEHFFGVFTRASGWGAQGRMPYEFYPWELHRGRELVDGAMLIGLVAALANLAASPRGLARALVWVIALGELWTTTTWGFFYNHGAGGPHYFAPFYLLAAAFIAGRTNWSRLPAPTGIVLCAILVAGLPWRFVVRQTETLAGAVASGRRFMTELRAVPGIHAAYSEDLQLFKTRYNGEVIDVGDMVAKVAVTGFFGPDFRARFEQTERHLRAHPPKLVVVGATSVLSPTLQKLIRDDYVQLLQSPPLIPAEQLPVTVYRLRN